MREVTIKIHSIAEDGLPDMDELVGRVAFLWNGAIVSGWPIRPEFATTPNTWEPSEDRFGGPLRGVTHWVEFPEPVWNYEKA